MGALALVLALIVWWLLANTVLVPDLVGLDRGEAMLRLAGARLEVGRVSTEYSDQYGRGEVVRQAPEAGQRAMRGADVEIVVAEQREESTTGGSSPVAPGQ